MVVSLYINRADNILFYYLRSELHYIARDKSTVYQANSAATAAATNTTIGVSLTASR